MGVVECEGPCADPKEERSVGAGDEVEASEDTERTSAFPSLVWQW